MLDYLPLFHRLLLTDPLSKPFWPFTIITILIAKWLKWSLQEKQPKILPSLMPSWPRALCNRPTLSSHPKAWRVPMPTYLKNIYAPFGWACTIAEVDLKALADWSTSSWVRLTVQKFKAFTRGFAFTWKKRTVSWTTSVTLPKSTWAQ